MSACYVYTITADGIVRYVGKGTGDRLARHFRKVAAAIRRRAAGDILRTSHLHHRMIRALADGAALEGCVLVDGLTDTEACERERQEIAARDGLWNLREGGEGWTSAEVKALWADPAHRARMTELAQTRWRCPTYRARVSEGMARMSEADRETQVRSLAAGRTVEARRRQGDSLKRTTSTPEGRAKMKAAAEARWAKYRAAKCQT